MVTHLAGKKDMMYQCMYCKKDISNTPWLSEVFHNIQYKIIVCNCGKKNWIKTRFTTSGHDNWHNKDKWLEIEELKRLKNEFDEIVTNFKVNNI